MTEHTPGPWTREPGQRFREMIQPESAGVRGPDGNYIATALDFNRFDRDDEVEANARLIAAAPDLLRALYAMQAAFAPETIDDPSFDPHGAIDRDEALSLMLAAIAKARGAD